MSTATADGAGGLPNAPSYHAASVGPLEQKHMRYANYRAVADDSRITADALAHRHRQQPRLGLRRHGRRDLRAGGAADHQGLRADRPASTGAACRSRCFIGIAGLYFWPWLSDRYGRRTLLALNIALFSLLMPVVAAVADLRGVRDRPLDRRLRAERRVVAGLDAGGGDLAGASARPGDQHQPRAPGASALRSPAPSPASPPRPGAGASP